jgi:uncharacterized DUF497 family protein
VEVVRFLLWDEHNIAHIAEHGVLPAEVEQVVFLPNALPPRRDNRVRVGRLVILGATVATRLLVVVLDAPTASGMAYVVTAYPMNERDRRRFWEVWDERA